MYLDYAELQAEKQKAMRMTDWVHKLNAFLQFNDYQILRDAGKVSKAIADAFAEGQYIKFRPIQDEAFVSDFDKITKGIRESGKLPSELKRHSQEFSSFNQSIKKALNYNPKGKKQG
jgi:hypothetical protein